MTAFTYGKAETFFHSNRHDEFDFKRSVVAGHYHFNALRELDVSGNVCRSEVELRLIASEERCMTSALFLFEDITLAFELGVRSNCAGLCENLTALNLVFVNAAKEYAYVVS